MTMYQMLKKMSIIEICSFIDKLEDKKRHGKGWRPVDQQALVDARRMLITGGI